MVRTAYQKNSNFGKKNCPLSLSPPKLFAKVNPWSVRNGFFFARCCLKGHCTEDRSEGLCTRCKPFHAEPNPICLNTAAGIGQNKSIGKGEGIQSWGNFDYDNSKPPF